MKRLITAVSFAVLASPVLAMPFEQTELDRQLPAIEGSSGSYYADSSAPFEQIQLDRALPSLGEKNARFAAAAGVTVSDATEGDSTNAWMDDHNVISPAQ